MADIRPKDLPSVSSVALLDRFLIDGSTTRSIAVSDITKTLVGFVTPQLFGCVADGVTDNATGWQAFRDYLATNLGMGGLIPAGVYVTSVSPNFAIQDLCIKTSGDVLIKYTGTGSGFLVDATGGTSSSIPGATNIFGCTGIRIERIRVQADGATNGVWIKKVHHGDFAFSVTGAIDNAFKIEGCVCSMFRGLTISYNEAPLTNRPTNGLLVTGASSEQNSFCTFEKPVIEMGGATTGILLDYSLGDNIDGGTSEGNGTGLAMTVNAFFTKVNGVDFEANTVSDIYCYGNHNTFTDVHSALSVRFDGVPATGNRIVGGTYNSISEINGATANFFDNMGYNFTGTGSLSLSTGSFVRRSYDMTTGTVSLLDIDPIPTGQVLGNFSGSTAQPTGHALVKADVGLSNVDNTSDANKPVSTAQAAANATKAATVKIQKFTSSGTYTPTTGLLYAVIECVGPGGAGGGTVGIATEARAGGGGGGGGYSRTVASAASIGASKTVTVGTGGVAASGANGGDGSGSTSVGTLCVANAGAGGKLNNASTGFGNPGAGAAVWAGAGANDVAEPGASGGFGPLYQTPANAPTLVVSGTGGSSFFGGGAPGNGSGSGTALAGIAAAIHGGGGSGGLSYSLATNTAGGNAANGLVVITEYINQ